MTPIAITVTGTIRESWTNMKCHSPVVAVDTFLAADWGRGHQGAGLGQGTDYHRNHAWRMRERMRVRSVKVPDKHPLSRNNTQGAKPCAQPWL